MLLIVVVGGCLQISRVENKKVNIGGVYTVDPQIVWSEFSGSSISSNGRVLTVDGLLLQRLDLFGGIEDGEALFSELGDAKEKLPVFREDMRANEVQELVIDALAQLGYVDIQASKLRPLDFGGRSGFRFDLAMATESGLEIKGLAAGATVNDELSLILYVGTRIHYFEARRGTVEAIIGSLVFEGSGV